MRLISTRHKSPDVGPFIQLAIESTLMIAPPPFFARTGAKARAMRSGPTKFTSNCSRAASTAPWARPPPGLAMPALLMSRLTFPATRAAATASSSLVTSSFRARRPLG